MRTSSIPREFGHSGQLMRVERVVSNAVLMLVETQSEQVEDGCTHSRVRLLEGNASASFISAQIAHSTCLRSMSVPWRNFVGGKSLLMVMWF